MITTEDLIETIRSSNGETTHQTQARIEQAAKALDITMPVEGRWHDDDADAICIRIAG